VPHEILVTLTRSGLDESHHHGAYCVFVGGRVARSRGDVAVPVYLRSAAKPFQAITVVESGALERFGITEEELALVAASHSSTPRHAQIAASILRKAGEGPELLRCGGHRPIDGKVAEDYIRRGVKPGRLEDNCSGKHGGMIAAAKALGEDPATYADPTHLVQRRNLENLALVAGVPEASIVRAMVLLLTRAKLLVEPTGALAAAAALEGLLPPELERVGVILSGGNIDPATLARILTDAP